VGFSFVEIRAPGLSQVPTKAPVIPDVVSIAATGAQSIASDAATVATRVASEAQSVASGAVTSIETAVDSIVPNNCSLGVEYFCIGFPDSIDCRTLPLNISNIIPSSLATIEQLNSIEDLDLVRSSDQ
jgi:hypothetical protein